MRGRISSLLAELKRRKVYHVTVAYVVLAVGGLEVIDLLIPSTRLPGWATPLFVGLAVVGLPIVVVLAWTFDITGSGVVRTPDREESAPPTPLPPVAGRRAEPEPEVRPDDAESAPSEPDPDPLAVAILPFENLSGSSEAEPFALGLHDDLLTELSRASSLTVISRTSVRAYRDSDQSLRSIARDLGAGTIVEGAVQMSGSRIRLNVQVIDARSDAHRWAEQFDRELSAETIFELQSELADHIMNALETRLTAEEASTPHLRPTDDLEAYRKYATGREFHIDRSEDGLRQAVELFEEAIELDPTYAQAWAGLGMALVGLVDYGHIESEALLERGEEACRRSLELDPNLAEGHAALGTLLTYQRKGPEAVNALRQAVRHSPGLSLGHQWLCWVRLLIGDARGALASAERATELDPLDPEARGNLGLAFLANGDAERAAAEAARVEELHPEFDYAIWVRGLALYHLDRAPEATETLASLKGRRFRPWGEMARALEALNRSDRPRALRRRDGMDGAFEKGVVHAALGELDAAFETMSSAMPLIWDDALFLRYFRAEPMDSLRGDPRFEELLRSLDRSWRIDA